MSTVYPNQILLLYLAEGCDLNDPYIITLFVGWNASDKIPGFPESRGATAEQTVVDRYTTPYVDKGLWHNTNFLVHLNVIAYPRARYYSRVQ